MTPALAAAMASWLAIPSRAAAEEVRTIDPPVFLMARDAARTVANAEPRFVRKTSVHSSGVVRCAGLSRSDPTQFAIPSRRPWRVSTSLTHESTSDGSVASTLEVATPRSSARASSRSWRRPTATTSHGSSNSWRQTAVPIPPVAPRTTNTGRSLLGTSRVTAGFQPPKCAGDSRHLVCRL